MLPTKEDINRPICNRRDVLAQFPSARSARINARCDTTKHRRAVVESEREYFLKQKPSNDLSKSCLCLKDDEEQALKCICHLNQMGVTAVGDVALTGKPRCAIRTGSKVEKDATGVSSDVKKWNVNMIYKTYRSDMLQMGG